MSRRLVPEQGWDSNTELVDDTWIERSPRRPEVRAALEVEVRLMPRLAALLPLSVPVPRAVAADADLPWRVRHRLVPGEPVEPATLTERDGRRVGRFLRVLHEVGFATYADTGLSTEARLPATLARMAAEVAPRLADLRRPGEALLERCGRPTPVTLVHGDLGPAHLLHTGCCVTGVIDWTDMGLRDPALDLAWLLNATARRFVDGLVTEYQPSAAERTRAADWHALGPWHEVLHGLDLSAAGDPRAHLHVDAGLDGVLARLRWLTGPR